MKAKLVASFLIAAWFALAFLLFGCTPDVGWKTVDIPNGCRINAEGFKSAYTAKKSQEKYYWTRVLIVFQDQKTAHAICVIQWGKDLWAYDAMYGTCWLSRNLALTSDPIALAKVWRDLTGFQPFVTAYFV